jgi:hypothetical protein
MLVLGLVLAGCQVKTEVKTSGFVGAAPSPPGAATPREALVEKDLALQEEAGAVLANVKDPASLASAKPRLAELAARHKQHKEELGKLGNTTVPELQEIGRKFGDRSKAAKANLAREMARVNSTVQGGGEVYVQMLDLWKGL